MKQTKLTPYAFPEGMEIPRLMPYQDYPWNGDHHLAAEVLRLKEEHGLTKALETGTCLGSTTLWLSENFVHVRTVEDDERYIAIARTRMCETTNVETHWERSSVIVALYAADFYFLDAHWGEECPLLYELDFIGEHGHKPCILIHDFHVPGTDFGYDCMPDGRPFNLDLIRGHLDRIYGEGKWRHNYPTQVAGAMRGWISIEPC